MLEGSVELEMSVLGALLSNTSAIHEVADMLDDADFTLPANRSIFQAVMRLHREGKPTDVVLVANELGHAIDRLGGLAYLSSLVQLEGGFSYNVREYADKLKAHRQRREYREVLETALNEAEDTPTLDTPMAHLRDRLNDIEAMRVDLSWDRRKEIYAELIDSLIDNPRDNSGVLPTGLQALDSFIGGFEAENLICVGARTGVGKSSFCTTIAHHIGVKLSRPVLFFTLEMSEKEMSGKLASLDSGIPWEIMAKNRMNSDEQARVRKSRERLEQAPLYIVTNASYLTDFRLVLTSMSRYVQPELVVVDYMQIVETKTRESRVAEVGAISRGLKQLARDFSVPVLAPAQLNRQIEYRANPEPTLADLRESGSIEQDSNIVILLSKPSLEAEERPPVETVTAYIAKNRMGKEGKAVLGYRGSHMQFVDPERRDSVMSVVKPGWGKHEPF